MFVILGWLYLVFTDDFTFLVDDKITFFFLLISLYILFAGVVVIFGELHDEFKVCLLVDNFRVSPLLILYGGDKLFILAKYK